MMDNVANEAIKARAEHYFTRILNLLARLNPKSSDVMADLTEFREAKTGDTRMGPRASVQETMDGLVAAGEP
jgi:hypothetical protein